MFRPSTNHDKKTLGPGPQSDYKINSVKISMDCSCISPSLPSALVEISVRDNVDHGQMQVGLAYLVSPEHFGTDWTSSAGHC